jgi:hypothetical protein
MYGLSSLEKRRKHKVGWLSQKGRKRKDDRQIKKLLNPQERSQARR